MCPFSRCRTDCVRAVLEILSFSFQAALRRAFATARFVYCRGMGGRVGAFLPLIGREDSAVSKYAVRRSASTCQAPRRVVRIANLWARCSGLAATTGFSRSFRGGFTRHPLTADRWVTEWSPGASTAAGSYTLIPVLVAETNVASLSRTRKVSGRDSEAFFF